MFLDSDYSIYKRYLPRFFPPVEKLPEKGGTCQTDSEEGKKHLGACVVKWKLTGLIIQGCEFEPCYGQLIVNLGKSLHLACCVDQIDIWYAVRGNVTI